MRFIQAIFFFLITASVSGQKDLKLISTYDQIPGIQDQPTEEGKNIKALFPFKDKLYIGYGDAGRSGGKNTGVHILFYDPLENKFDTSYFTSTRNITRFYEFQGDVFIPNNDPVGHFGGLFRLDGQTGVWDSTEHVPGAAHVYDVVGFNGRLYASTGSFFETGAVVASSVDKGKTWVVELESKNEAFEDSSYYFSRHYFLGATKNYLFMMGMKHFVAPDNSFSKHASFSYIYRNNEWKELKMALEWYQQPIVLNDSMIAVRKVHGPIFKDFSSVQGDSLIALNNFVPGIGMSAFFIDRTVDPEILYTVIAKDSANTAIFTTSNFSDWSHITDLPQPNEDDAYGSIAVLKNKIYLGTKQGALYVIDN